MTAPIQLDGPYRSRRNRMTRLRRALVHWQARQWLGAWLEVAVLAIVVAAVVVGLPFVARVLTAYLPTL